VRRGVPIAIAASLALAGCAAPGVEEDATVRGARAAVETYVDAVAGLDLETATAMSSPEALAAPDGRTPAVDVTAALPQAIVGIEDAWIVYDGIDYAYLDPDVSETTDVVWFTVSYEVDGIPGAGSVEVTLVGDDPAAEDDWQVTDGLLVESPSHVDDAIATSTLGGVELEAGPSNDYQPLWGYPGMYLHEATTFAAGVDPGATATPVEVPIGVTIEPGWDESLRILELDEP